MITEDTVADIVVEDITAGDMVVEDTVENKVVEGTVEDMVVEGVVEDTVGDMVVEDRVTEIVEDTVEVTVDIAMEGIIVEVTVGVVVVGIVVEDIVDMMVKAGNEEYMMKHLQQDLASHPPRRRLYLLTLLLLEGHLTGLLRHLDLKAQHLPWRLPSGVHLLDHLNLVTNLYLWPQSCWPLSLHLHFSPSQLHLQARHHPRQYPNHPPSQPCRLLL